MTLSLIGVYIPVNSEATEATNSLRAKTLFDFSSAVIVLHWNGKQNSIKENESQDTNIAQAA